jgi:hypothetical protein
VDPKRELVMERLGSGYAGQSWEHLFRSLAASYGAP